MAALDYRNPPPYLEDVTYIPRRMELRIYPNEAQKEYLAKTFGCARFVYNRLLGSHSEAYTTYQDKLLADPDLTDKPPSPNRSTLSAALTALKAEPEYHWLNEVSSVPLQQSTGDLAEAFSNFFKGRSKYPRFKCKRSNKHSAYYTTDGFRVEDGRLRLAKLDKTIAMRNIKYLEQYPSSVTITKRPSGKYYASFVTSKAIRRKVGEGFVGLDVGIKSLAVDSDGVVYDNPTFLRKAQNRLARHQHILSRRVGAKKGQKPSSNYSKQRLKVAKLHEHVSHCRKDYTHKLTTALVHENQAIVLESLNIKGMVKNHCLAKSIHDVSWGMLCRQIVYKLTETPVGTVYIADPFYPSSQTCSTCNTVRTDKLSLKDRKWTCPTCSSRHDRDHNAAINLRNRGKLVSYAAESGLIKDPGRVVYMAKYNDVLAKDSVLYDMLSDSLQWTRTEPSTAGHAG